jgi:transcriptional regulator with XRE-family HTH domain
MSIIYRFNGELELQIILKSLKIVPSNIEIATKTGISQSSISEVMNGKRRPTRTFIEKFKQGLNIKDEDIIQNQPPEGQEGLKDKLISVLETTINLLRSENERLERKIKDYEK